MLLKALRWMHYKNSVFPFGHPFFLLAEGEKRTSVNQIEVELPRDFESYKKLSDHIKDHPNPTDKDYEKGKNPLHLDGILSIAGQLADGLSVAEEANVLLRITPESVRAKKSRTPGSAYREWEVRISDFSHATRAKDGYQGREGMELSQLSPEEISGGKSTKYSERYRLGIMLYTLLTRRNPLESGGELAKVIEAEREMYIDLTQATLKRDFTPLEKKELADRDKLPRNWATLSEKKKGLYLAERLFDRIEKGKDLALDNRMWNEPESARKEIYALLKGLLAPEGEKRTEPKTAFARMRKLEESYLRFINYKLTKGSESIHVGREYEKKENVNELGRGAMGEVLAVDGYMLRTGWRVIPSAAKVNLSENDPEKINFEREAEVYEILGDIKNVISLRRNSILGSLNGFEQRSGRPILDENGNAIPGRTVIFERVFDDLNSSSRLKPYDNVEHLYNVISVFVKIAETTQKVHERGIIHRDGKPENFAMKDGTWDPDGVRILDFGIAYNKNNPEQVAEEAADTGTVKGTPFYMSPEMVTGKEAVPQSDVWMLAISLYEFIYGEKMANIGADSVVEIMGGTHRGKRSSKVIATLRDGAIFTGIREFRADGEAPRAIPKSLAILQNDVQPGDSSGIDTLPARPQNVGNPAESGPINFGVGELNREGLNDIGAHVQSLLFNIFGNALQLEPAFRPDMKKLARELAGVRDYLDGKFKFSERRPAKKQGRDF